MNKDNSLIIKSNLGIIEEHTYTSDSQINTVTADENKIEEIKINVNSDKQIKKINDNNVSNFLTEKVTINILVIGDTKSGKSSLVNSFLNKTFNDDQDYTEHLIKTTTKTFQLKSVIFDVCFIELSGNLERDQNLIKEYLPMGNAVIICHSLENNFQESKIEKWVNIIPSDILKFLIGCKLDVFLMNKFDTPNELENISDDEAFIEENLQEEDILSPNKSIIKLVNMNTINSENQVKDSILHNDTWISKKLEFFDLPQFIGLRKQARDFISNNKIEEYYFTSSFLGYNVNSVFDSIIKTYVSNFLLKMKNNNINVEEEYGCIIF